MALQFLTISTLLLVGGIIWFVWHGSDAKQTLLNMIVASGCWTVIAQVICLFWPEIFRFLYGPLPKQFCFVSTFSKYVILSNYILYFDAISVTR